MFYVVTQTTAYFGLTPHAS